MQKSYYRTLFNSWHNLLSRLFLSAFVSYGTVLFLTGIGKVEPRTVLGVTTSGIHNVGVPLINKGITFGIPEALGIFLCNSLVAFLISSALALALFYNPKRQTGQLQFLRGTSDRNPGTRLSRLPGCKRIEHPSLCATSFCLYLIPQVAMIFFGLIIGNMIASGQYVFGSLGGVMARLAPHGVFEIPALVLAAAIPFSGYRLAKKELRRGRVSRAYLLLERYRASRPVQLALIIIISLLWVAGAIEAGLS